MHLNRAPGLLVLLPLYIAIATAIGFADYWVRPHPQHGYTTYVPAVVNGTEGPPGKYRVLAPMAFTAMVRATGLEAGDVWVVFRWLCLIGALAAGHLLFRTWFTSAGALAGNALVATLLPLTFTNSWAHPDHLLELALVTLGYACIARRSLGVLAVIALASLNRETSFILVIVLALSARFDRRHLVRVAMAGLVWLAVYVGLRWRLGYVPYDPVQIRANLFSLFSWPSFAHDRDLYSRLFGWFFVILIASPIAAVVRTWSVQPRFSRMAFAIVIPIFVAIGFTFSSVIETRIFTPLLPLIAAGLLFAVIPPDARIAQLER